MDEQKWNKQLKRTNLNVTNTAIIGMYSLICLLVAFGEGCV